MIVNPWGKVVVSAGIDEEIVVHDLDMSVVQQVREQIPIFKQVVNYNFKYFFPFLIRFFICSAVWICMTQFQSFNHHKP